MPTIPIDPGPSPQFAQALASIEGVSVRRELAVSEITAPAGLAPESFALAADVVPEHSDGTSLCTGRFILLYDRNEPIEWGGPFRVVCFAQASLEIDIGLDPLLADVTWSWLMDALDVYAGDYIAPSGTATRILSSGFGQLHAQGEGAQIELRASWTPLDSDAGGHVQAWGELLCMLAGVPPETPGVSVLRRGIPAFDTPGTPRFATPGTPATPGPPRFSTPGPPGVAR